MADLSIVIVNWNTRDLLAQCLDSIYQSGNEPVIELIVVDNASSDGSQGMILERFPQTRLIQNPTNVGFARANNQGILQSRGRYVLLLNSDTLVRSGALQSLLEFMDNHVEAGAASARLLNADGSLQYSCSPAPTLTSEFLRMFHLPGIRADGYYSMDEWDVNQPRSVDVLLGACMLIRREALDQVGLLDEQYFMYSEEVDLCSRLRSSGWRLYWVPTAEVVHFGGQSTRQASADMFLRLYESKLIYFRKNYGRIHALAYKMLLMISSLVRILLVPLVWLEDSQRRRVHLTTAMNYHRLLMKLPSL
jgi:N-acetylglucosaminyl-diphospho-decaprenol L-rhamnosyltransferase